MVEKNYLNDFYEQLKNKMSESSDISYTSKLLEDKNLLSKKIVEESVEVIIEINKKNKEKLIMESADLIYHLIVSWLSNNINPDEVWDELERRKKISGIIEKNSRK